MRRDQRKILKSFRGKQVLVTAGPTYERIDPVRFIGNFSTGKMGYAITNLLCAGGAKVSLISGPTHLKPDYHLKKYIRVESAAT